MRVLTDYHHHALAESLEMTLGDRLGMEVWFPAGMDWFPSVWRFEQKWHGDAVAKQYLEGIWTEAEDNGAGTMLRPDRRHPGRVNKGVTLEAAMGQSWDYVIASLPDNYDGFRRVAEVTGAKYGIQIGNEAQPFDSAADFALSSSTLPGFGPDWIGRRFPVHGVPTLMYHQEFSTDYFRHEWPPATKAIASWVQCFAENAVPYAEFLSLARQTPEFDWRVYGAYGSHPVDEYACGNIDPVPLIADEMRACRVIWHSKSWSDGYGHVIHNAFAIGRPVVGRASYYASKLAAPLWVDGVTSFDIDRRSQDELIGLLARLVNDDDYHREISENAARRFAEVVDFDADAQAVKELLEAVS